MTEKEMMIRISSQLEQQFARIHNATDLIYEQNGDDLFEEFVDICFTEDIDRLYDYLQSGHVDIQSLFQYMLCCVKITFLQTTFNEAKGAK